MGAPVPWGVLLGFVSLHEELPKLEGQLSAGTEPCRIRPVEAGPAHWDEPVAEPALADAPSRHDTGRQADEARFFESGSYF
jgi:hypothetical protein